MEEKEIVKEFKRISERINDLGKRIGGQSDQRHHEATASINDLEDLVVDVMYKQTLDELDV